VPGPICCKELEIESRARCVTFPSVQLPLRYAVESDMDRWISMGGLTIVFFVIVCNFQIEYSRRLGNVHNVLTPKGEE